MVYENFDFYRTNIETRPQILSVALCHLMSMREELDDVYYRKAYTILEEHMVDRLLDRQVCS